jgi:hypothetical protein
LQNQRIVVYVHNEEIEGLAEFANRLRKQGASVNFRALKWREPENGDVHLTFKRYEDTVKKFHPDAKLQFIDDEQVKPIDPPAPEPVKTVEPVIEVKAKPEPEPEPEVVPEFVDDGPIVVTAGDASVEAPTKPRRKTPDAPTEEPAGE